MKNNSLIFALLCAMLMWQCGRKDDISETKRISDNDMNAGAEQSRDNKNVEDNIDQAIDDVADQIQSFAGGRMDAAQNCGYTVSTISGSSKSFRITFNGQNCALVGSRTGIITVNLTDGTKYEEKGAKWTITYDAYAVTYRGTTLTFTGTQTVENLTGGTPGQVLFGFLTNVTTVSHLISSNNMQIRFGENGAARTWNVARKISWSFVGNKYLWKMEGVGSADGYTNLVTWGSNRSGEKFYTQITTPINLNFNDCWVTRPTSGVRKHTLFLAPDDKIEINEALTGFDDKGCSNQYTLTVSRGVNVRVKVINF